MGSLLKALANCAHALVLFCFHQGPTSGFVVPPDFRAERFSLPDITSMRGHCLKKQKLELSIQEGKACRDINPRLPTILKRQAFDPEHVNWNINVELVAFSRNAECIYLNKFTIQGSAECQPLSSKLALDLEVIFWTCFFVICLYKILASRTLADLSAATVLFCTLLPFCREMNWSLGFGF